MTLRKLLFSITLAGTLPLVTTADPIALSVAPVSGEPNRIRVGWTAVPDREYELQWSADLVNWTVLDGFPSKAIEVDMDHTLVPASTHGFYRLLARAESTVEYTIVGLSSLGPEADELQSWAAGTDAAGNLLLIRLEKGYSAEDDVFWDRLWLQRFTSQGDPVANPVLLLESREDLDDPELLDSMIAVAPNGAFVVLWVHDNYDEGLEQILAQSYGVTGAPIGNPSVLATASGSSSTLTLGSAHLDNAGTLLATWHEDSWAPGSLYQDRVFVQRFDSQGQALTDPWLAASADEDAGIFWLRYPGVATAPDGRHTVFWVEDRGVGPEPIMVRELGAEGFVDEKRTLVELPTATIASSTVIRDGAGVWWVAWIQGDTDTGEFRTRILVQRFTAEGTPLSAPVAVADRPEVVIWSELVLVELPDAAYAAIWREDSSIQASFFRP